MMIELHASNGSADQSTHDEQLAGLPKSVHLAPWGRCAVAGLAVLGIIMTLLSTAPVRATEELTTTHWWDDFPLIVQGDVSLTTDLNGTISFGGGETDPSWGIYGQKVNEGPQTTAIHRAGYKSLSYFETFGTVTSYIVSLGVKGSLDYTPNTCSHWAWQYYNGVDPRVWIGPQNYFGVEAFAGAYTRLHPRYGGPAMTYPDGTVATGYVGNDSSDPRKSRVLDASVSKNVLGQMNCDPGFNDAAQSAGTSTGMLDFGGRYAGHLSFGKDALCPYWIDFQRASTLKAADRGCDGIWTDNFSPWDSFSAWPINVAFGDWSVAKFRDYLAAHFSAQELSALGIVDVNTFDVRTYLRNKIKSMGGNDTNLGDWRWTRSTWLDDAVWRAYKIFKRQTGTQALTNFYNTTKQAAAEAGKTEFFIEGNDMPMFSLGWVRGDLDMVSTEMNADWSLGAGSRGIMLPPLGRFAPVYKLGREHAKSRFVNIWFYLHNENAKYQRNSGLANVLGYEMLANNTISMNYPGQPWCMGNTISNRDYFGFIKDNKATWGARLPVEEIGLYWSSSSEIYQMTPGGFANFDLRPQMFAHWGWGTALSELHCQYRAIPEWKLTPETLATLRLLIVPDSEIFDPADVAVLDTWVRAGGRLIVTGMSGMRKGEPSNFDPFDPDYDPAMPNEANLSLASLTGANTLASAPARKLTQVGAGQVLYIRNNIGLSFFQATTARPGQLPTFKQALTDILAGQGPLALTPDPAVPDTVGLTLYLDQQAKKMFIDVNNTNIDVDTDQITPAPEVKFTVQLPAWLQNPDKVEIKSQVLAPQELADNDPPPPTIQMRRIGNNQAEITLSPILVYASIVLESQVKPLTVTNLSRFYQLDTLQVGKLLYRDRAFVFTDPIPASLIGQTYIRTMNGDKTLSGTEVLSFDVNQFVEVTVALDARYGEAPPSWLKDWHKLDEQLSTDDVSATGQGQRTLYRRSFPAGKVTLGGNFEEGLETAYSMYTVIIVPADNAVADWKDYH